MLLKRCGLQFWNCIPLLTRDKRRPISFTKITFPDTHTWRWHQRCNKTFAWWYWWPARTPTRCPLRGRTCRLTSPGRSKPRMSPTGWPLRWRSPSDWPLRPVICFCVTSLSWPSRVVGQRPSSAGPGSRDRKRWRRRLAWRCRQTRVHAYTSAANLAPTSNKADEWRRVLSI